MNAAPRAYILKHRGFVPKMDRQCRAPIILSLSLAWTNSL